MAWRPTRGLTEGFCWDYQLSQQCWPFLILSGSWQKTEGVPVPAPPCSGGHGQSLCVLDLCLSLGLCSEAALSHKPSLGRRGIDRCGGGGVLQSCQDKALTRSVSSRTLLSFPQMLGMPCFVARGLRGQCHTLTECSPLFRSELKRKTHVHQMKALLPNIKYCFLIPSVAKCAVKMFRRLFNYFHFKNVFMSPILFTRLAKVL